MIDVDAAPRALGAEIRRAQDARALIQIGLQLRAGPGVIAERDHVGPGAEDEIGLLRRDADDIGVFAVDHRKGNVILLFEGLEPLFQTVQPRLPAHVPDRQYFHNHRQTLPRMKQFYIFIYYHKLHGDGKSFAHILFTD